MGVYEPREDSILLEKFVRQYSRGSVLDMGTGSGIQALAAANNKKVREVLAIDIQDEIVSCNKKNIKNKNIKFYASDLFDVFKKNHALKNKKFDTIIFNPPYLPEDVRVKDLTLDGGKKGYEILERFINEANKYLKAEGIMLILFSSLTNKGKIDEFLGNNLMEFEELAKKSIFFEHLYVYLIKKNVISKKLEKRGIKSIRYFNKGKRGLIFIGCFKDKKVAIKIKNPQSKAEFRISNEANFLKCLNKKKIGPKLLFSDEYYIVYGFVEGSFIVDFLNNNGKGIIKKVLKNILIQLFEMDKLGINKEEMSHPPEHIIVDKKNMPVLIDFERARHVLKPGNVTQFCNYLISSNISKILKDKSIVLDKDDIIRFAKEYKGNIRSNNLKNVIDEIR
jgi:HemK-related putative methylase